MRIVWKGAAPDLQREPQRIIYSLLPVCPCLLACAGSPRVHCGCRQI